MSGKPESHGSGRERAGVRVLCVDDNEMVGESLRQRFGRERDFAWVGVEHDGRRALDAVIESKPHVVLMDIDMPGIDSFDCVERIGVEAPHVRVVMFSGHVSVAYINRALDCGAWGYLSKNDAVDRLIEAVRRVADGEFAFSEEVRAAQRTA